MGIGETLTAIVSVVCFTFIAICIIYKDKEGK